jgi:hypothetical protein
LPVAEVESEELGAAPTAETALVDRSAESHDTALRIFFNMDLLVLG